MFGPKIPGIIGKEKGLIDFIIDKTPGDFSLERFKQEYAFYLKTFDRYFPISL
jgi:hypothetical protein